MWVSIVLAPDYCLSIYFVIIVVMYVSVSMRVWIEGELCACVRWWLWWGGVCVAGVFCQNKPVVGKSRVQQHVGLMEELRVYKIRMN